MQINDRHGLSHGRALHRLARLFAERASAVAVRREKMGLNDQWMQRDLKVLWHPCTQMKDHEQLPLIPIKRGEGIWLEDFEGKRYLDAVSSWWVNVFGHANPRINQRIKDQVDQLEHVILAGFSHQPVIELSERLVAMTPEGLTRCFYADN